VSGAVSRWLFHQITDKDYVYTPAARGRDDEGEDSSVAQFVARFGGNLTFAGKTVLDIGCGMGSMAAEAAQQGAAKVVGIDLEVRMAEEQIARRFADVADRIELVTTAGDLEEIAGRGFDLVISKDAFEHYPEPETFVPRITRFVAPGGELAIGFSPLWKSPQGGHIYFMTKVPWAHLMFSEQTIMAERKRFRPDEEAETFEEVRGGLNKMTYARFRGLMAETGFEPIYFETNVGDSRAVKAMRALAEIRPLREYFTQSVYSIWRNPAAPATSG
jgi:2-polyprenyl-3-methyl-5-hydroxy-6-metoxy-1,4-benzoquinol methylase